MDDNGLCVDTIHCIEDEHGKCVKCTTFSGDFYYHCLNSDFGCVETCEDNCLECNDISDFNICTKCMKGYKLNKYGGCSKNDEEEK